MMDWGLISLLKRNREEPIYPSPRQNGYQDGKLGQYRNWYWSQVDRNDYDSGYVIGINAVRENT